jgi:hypothetical protein
MHNLYMNGYSVTPRLERGFFLMGRMHSQKTRDKNKSTLPQVPKNLKTDGKDVEFSQELADQADLEAQSRSNAANQRVIKKNKC